MNFLNFWKSKKVRYASCAGAVLLAVLLVISLINREKPTGGEVSPPTQPTTNPKPLISSTEPTTQPFWEVTEPTEATEPPPSLDPITKLSSVKWQTLPQFLDLGDGLVLACRNDYEEGSGVVCYLEVLNVYTDTVQKQKKLSSSKKLVEQCFQDGSFVLKDQNDDTLYVYDRTLQQQASFSAPSIDGYFSQNLKEYFFVNNSVLYRMNVSSGNYAQMALEYDLRLESLIGVHPDWDIVIAKFYTSPFSENCGVCVIDCNTGNILLLNDTISHLWFDGANFYAAGTNSHSYGNDIYIGNLSDGVEKLARADHLGGDTVSYTMLPGTGFMMLRTTDDNNLTTTLYDLERYGISSPLEQYDYITATLGSVYLRQAQLILGVCQQEEEFSPVVIDPKVLRYEKRLSLYQESWPALVDRKIILNYQAEVKGPDLPDSLSQLRQQADALEKKYAIKIGIENQPIDLCGSYASMEADPKNIAQALTVLEQALAQYPRGFPAQFRNDIGEGGLYFCLTGAIDGSLNPVGKATKAGSFYVLVLDITSDRLSNTIHHELWHAIEMKLSTDSFDNPRWQAANPQGFLYYGRYDSGYQNLTQWTYEADGSQCHFVDAYCRINATEDRARLMETVMTADASALLQSPALYEKLSIMSKAIRDHFNTQGWDTPYWERYLQNA